VFILSVDLGQSVDYTAISIVEQIQAHELDGAGSAYLLRYLHRAPLGTTYPVIVGQVLSLLDRTPLSRSETPLVVDRTGVGAAVVDMFTAAGVRPRAITIHGGDGVVDTDRWNLRVPKRDLAGTLVALFQTGRLKIAAGLALAPVLARELLNFKVKVNVASGHDSYEAWREGVHDDLVLSVAMACWYGEYQGAPAGVWCLT
jgi:hypothetical protein